MVPGSAHRLTVIRCSIHELTTTSLRLMKRKLNKRQQPARDS